MAYSYKVSITIDNTKVSGASDHTNFPVLVSGTYDGTAGEPDIRTIGNGGNVENTDASGGADGSTTVPADLDFFSDVDLTTGLDFEIESYNATTGEIVAWVEIPTLDVDADTVIYMGYGDSNVTTSQENVGGTWNANYQSVWNFVESGGTNLSDSLGNNDVTADNSSIVGSTGLQGNCIEGDGSNGAQNTNPTSGIKPDEGDFSVSFMIDGSTTSGTGYHFLGVFALGGYDSGWGLVMDKSSGSLTYFFGAGSSGLNHATGLSIGGLLDGNPHHVVVTWDGMDQNNNIKTYKDGSIVDNKGVSGSREIAYLSQTDLHFVESTTAKLDSVRMLDVRLSSDWIATEYNSQSSPSTFYTMGSEAGVNLSNPIFFNTGVALG